MSRTPTKSAQASLGESCAAYARNGVRRQRDNAEERGNRKEEVASSRRDLYRVDLEEDRQQRRESRQRRSTQLQRVQA